jgi:hypothetical protein
MKINQNLIIGGVLVGGGLYYAYSKGWFKKKPTSPTETANEVKQENQQVINDIKQEQKAVIKENVKKAVITAAIKTATTSLANPNSLDSKVKKLQGLLKVGTDVKTYMSPNSATNKALAATYGLDKGVVSAANVDYYIAKVQSNNTLIKQSILAKQAGSPTATAAAINNKGTIRMLKDVNAPNLVKNKATGGFTAIGTKLLFKSGSVLGSGWTATARANTNDIVITKNGTTFQQIPANSIVVI